MLRAFLGLAVALVLSVGLLAADDKAQQDKNKNKEGRQKATITKVDPTNRTVTLRMTDKSGKTTERTFKLTEEVRMLDSSGRVAAVDIFQSGDEVLVIEAEGRLKEMKKHDQNKRNEKTTEAKPKGK
jgi:hypothetical protein